MKSFERIREHREANRQQKKQRRKKRSQRATANQNQIQTLFVAGTESLQRITRHQIRQQERTGAAHQITGAADQTYPTVKDFT